MVINDSYPPSTLDQKQVKLFFAINRIHFVLILVIFSVFGSFHDGLPLYRTSSILESTELLGKEAFLFGGFGFAATSSSGIVHDV